jgi:F-type H+-transporting ATPase subunit epsilon
MNLQVKILTPEKLIWNTTSDEVILPAKRGNLAILKDHVSMYTLLDAGLVRIKIEDNWKPLILVGGFAVIEDNSVIIFGNGAEDIDPNLSKSTAEERLTSVSEEFENIKINAKTNINISKKQIDEAELSVKLAKARLAAIEL